MRRVMPIYLVVNTSSSLAPRLHEVDHLLTALADELSYSPLLGDRVRVCLVTFSDTARCVLPLSDLTEGFVVPKLSPGRETQYGPLFQLLGRLMQSDAHAHVALGVAFYRPLMVLITDGVPLDPYWRPAFSKFYRSSHPRTVLVTVGLDAVRAHEMGTDLQASTVRVLDDAPDQPLAAQVKRLLMAHINELTTSRMTFRPEEL